MVDGWKCLNKDCGRTFYLPARKLVKPHSQAWASELSSVEMYCCPFCYGIEFEPVNKENKKE